MVRFSPLDRECYSKGDRYGSSQKSRGLGEMYYLVEGYQGNMEKCVRVQAVMSSQLEGAVAHMLGKGIADKCLVSLITEDVFAQFYVERNAKGGRPRVQDIRQ